MPVFMLTVPVGQEDAVIENLRVTLGNDVNRVHIGLDHTTKNDGIEYLRVVVDITCRVTPTCISKITHVPVEDILAQNKCQTNGNAWSRFLFYADRGNEKITRY